MLVLSRRKNESIVINDNIVVLVVDVRTDKVRLGITAPPNVTVHRREVYDSIRRQTSIHVIDTMSVDTMSDEVLTGAEETTSPQPEKSAPKTKPIAKKVIKKKS